VRTWRKTADCEEEENIIAQQEHNRLESELPPFDTSRGGVLITGYRNAWKGRCSQN
jgi:hypothetical protein